MNYKNTFFQIDPMVIFKQSSPTFTKVIRLDEEHVLEFEDHLATAWVMFSEKKSLDDVLNHFISLGLGKDEATEVLDKLTAILVEQKLGMIIPATEEAK